MKTVYLQNLRKELDATDDSFAASCCNTLGIPRDALLRLRIVRQALDARKKNDIFYCVHAELTVGDAAANAGMEATSKATTSTKGTSALQNLFMEHLLLSYMICI